MPDDLVSAEEQVCNADILLDAVRIAVKLALAEPRKMQHRLAQSLAGNGAGVDADPPNDCSSLDDRHALVELGRLDGGALARRAGPNHEQIVVVFTHSAPPLDDHCSGSWIGLQHNNGVLACATGGRRPFRVRRTSTQLAQVHSKATRSQKRTS